MKHVLRMLIGLLIMGLIVGVLLGGMAYLSDYRDSSITRLCAETLIAFLCVLLGIKAYEIGKEILK